MSGFMSSGLCGPTEDMDMLLLSRLNPGTNKFYVIKGIRFFSFFLFFCKTTGLVFFFLRESFKNSKILFALGSLNYIILNIY